MLTLLLPMFDGLMFWGRVHLTTTNKSWFCGKHVTSVPRTPLHLFYVNILGLSFQNTTNVQIVQYITFLNCTAPFKRINNVTTAHLMGGLKWVKRKQPTVSGWKDEMLSLNSKADCLMAAVRFYLRRETFEGNFSPSVLTDKSRDFREPRHKYLIEIRQVRRLNL